MVKVIKTDEIEEGMILAHPVLNGFRQVLLTAGTVLNRKHLTILKTWNVYNISITEGDSGEDEIIPKEIIENSREMVLKSLSWSPRNTYEEDLINMASFRKAKISLMKGANN
jgi:hypothetical protein